MCTLSSHVKYLHLYARCINTNALMNMCVCVYNSHEDSGKIIGLAQMLDFVHAGHLKTAEYVAERFIEVIEQVGPQHVTAVTTDNAANCKAAGDIIQVCAAALCVWLDQKNTLKSCPKNARALNFRRGTRTSHGLAATPTSWTLPLPTLARWLGLSRPFLRRKR